MKKKSNKAQSQDLLIPGNTPGLFSEESSTKNEKAEKAEKIKEKKVESAQKTAKPLPKKAMIVIISCVFAVIFALVVFMVSVLLHEAGPIDAVFNTAEALLCDNDIFALLEKFDDKGGELDFALDISDHGNKESVSGIYAEDADVGMLDLKYIYGGQKVDLSAAFGKDEVAFNFPEYDDELWLGFGTRKFREALDNSIFAYGSDSSFGMTYSDEKALKKFFSAYYDGVVREKGTDHVKDALRGPVKEISKFLSDLEVKGDSTITLLGNTKVEATTYSYEFTVKEITMLWELLIDEYYENEAFARFIDEIMDDFVADAETYIRRARKYDPRIELELFIYKNKLVALNYECKQKPSSSILPDIETQQYSVRVTFDKEPSLKTGFEITYTDALLVDSDGVASSVTTTISAGVLDDTDEKFSWYMFVDSTETNSTSMELEFTHDKDTGKYVLSLSKPAPGKPNNPTASKGGDRYYWVYSSGTLLLEEDSLELEIDSLMISGEALDIMATDGNSGGTIVFPEIDKSSTSFPIVKKTYIIISGYVEIHAEKQSLKLPEYDDVFTMDEEELEEYLSEIEDSFYRKSDNVDETIPDFG